MPYIEVSIEIKGNKYDIYNVAKEMEEFPKYMKDVKSVKITERFDNKTITEWQSDLDEAPVWWRELDEFDDNAPKITYKLIEGDLEKFEGEWRFEDTDNGTKVTLTVDYDFGIPAFENVVGPILKIKVENNCKMMLSAIKERIEKWLI